LITQKVSKLLHASEEPSVLLAKKVMRTSCFVFSISSSFCSMLL